MKIVFVNYFYDEKWNSEMDLLRQYYTVIGWSEALQRAGADVTVISRFKKDSQISVNNVDYIFVKDNIGPLVRAWQIPVKLLYTVAKLKPDAIHLHHLSLSLPTMLLRILLPRKTGIFIQHHGGKTVHNWKMSVHNWLHRWADGYFFTTREQGEWWFTNKNQRKKIMPVMEGATFFNFDTRDTDNRPAQKTGMTGNPVFLWVGRLDQNKDPLTVVNGFQKLLQEFPQAKLYMIYNKDELHATMDKAVLLGNIPHEKIKDYYDSADYFVLGSHYEGSGYALSEALRCGCVPIITDIPSFRMMTNNGTLGALWQPGDSDSFVTAAKKAMSKPLREEAIKCTEYYNQCLSFDAIARIALKYYKERKYK